MQKTFKETKIVGGIEYMEYPPPPILIRATKKELADDFISKGYFRIILLDHYKSLEEDSGLGDKNEGKGLFLYNGHHIETGSSFSQYVFCMSLPTANPTRLLGINNYDTILEIKTLGLLSKVRAYFPSTYWMQSGSVQYNRGEEVTKQTLNNQQFNFNAFQKNPNYRYQQEYRFSIIYSPHEYYCEYLEVFLGDCSNIISVLAEY